MRWEGFDAEPPPLVRGTPGEGLLAAAAMLLLVMALTVLQYGALRERLREELLTQAEIVGRTANAAVLFDSEGDAREILASLSGSPLVRSARLFRADRTSLAGYHRATEPPHWWARYVGLEEVEHTIVANGMAVGRLQMSADLTGVWTALFKFVGGAVAVMAVALALATAVSRRLRAKVRESEARTRFLASHDALTGLPNRNTFQALMHHARAHWDRNSRTDALLFVDLDNFKQINDRMGHAAGDAVLKVVAHRLRDTVREGDVVARLAGDEFALLLESVNANVATRVADELVRKVPMPMKVEGNELRVSVSIGVALLPADARTPEEAMRCADAAMYQAKRTGKDGYHFYSSQLGEAMKARLTLETDLRAGIPRGEISLAYQPIFDSHGRLVSFEALSRWHRPGQGEVPPTEFVPVAESSELIVPLGLSVLRQLRADLDAWQRAGLEVPTVALNLSSRQFRRDAHRQSYLDALRELSLGPATVEFELTESNVFEDMDSPHSVVVALQSLGYPLAIDDFGTGYSSLGYLRRMRCRKLKIDRLFIKGVSGSEEASMLVQSMIDVAHALQMQVVAEGIETERDHAHLRALGCDYYQGFGLAKPLMPEDAAALMRRQAAGERASIGCRDGIGGRQ